MKNGVTTPDMAVLVTSASGGMFVAMQEIMQIIIEIYL